MKANLFWIKHLPVMAMILVATLFCAFSGNRAIMTVSEYQKASFRHCIVIDAGHGGEDGGATSCTGILESRFKLEIALRIEQVFSLLGYKTVMVRSDDRAIHTQGNTIAARKASDLKARVQLVNGTDRGVLISIHQNYFPESKYSGAQVFYSKTDGSKELANELQQSFIDTVNQGSRRRAKSAAGIYLMDHVICPAVLIECGFLSNPDEELKLRNEGYQKELSCIIATTVAKYFFDLT